MTLRGRQRPTLLAASAMTVAAALTAGGGATSAPPAAIILGAAAGAAPKPRKPKPDQSSQCWITSRECKRFPHLNGKRIRDVYGEGMLDVGNTRFASYCLRRAEDFHAWCGNGRADDRARVAASWVRLTKYNATEVAEFEAQQQLATAAKSGLRDGSSADSSSSAASSSPGTGTGSSSGAPNAAGGTGAGASATPSKGPRGKGKGRRKLEDMEKKSRTPDSEQKPNDRYVNKRSSSKSFLEDTQELTTQVYHPTACDPGWSLYDRHCYIFVWKMKTWWEAEQWCNQFSEAGEDGAEAIPSNLCSIHGKAENEFVFTLTKGISSWIGYHDNDQDEVKEWSDNSKTDYENMAKNCTGREETDPDCKPVEQAQQWYDFQGETRSTWVCKKPLRKNGRFGRAGIVTEKRPLVVTAGGGDGVSGMLDAVAATNWEDQKLPMPEEEEAEAAEQKGAMPIADKEDGTGTGVERSTAGLESLAVDSASPGVAPNIPSHCVDGNC